MNTSRSTSGIGTLALLAIAVYSLTACEFNAAVSERSGTLKDDYVEEPLTKRSKKYSRALETSNKILDMIKSESFGEIYDRHSSADLKSQTSRVQLIGYLTAVTREKGPLERFKPMQWAFEPTEIEGKSAIISSKIAEHTQGKLRYIFAFEEGSDYTELMTLKVLDYSAP